MCVRVCVCHFSPFKVITYFGFSPSGGKINLFTLVLSVTFPHPDPIFVRDIELMMMIIHIFYLQISHDKTIFKIILKLRDEKFTQL